MLDVVAQMSKCRGWIKRRRFDIFDTPCAGRMERKAAKTVDSFAKIRRVV